ncbi:hypothetical protein BLOT_014752 [Blomia tropicalis]|nr:hypothetical protein BLOT_014752 [Blomia tropicalis]
MASNVFIRVANFIQWQPLVGWWHMRKRKVSLLENGIVVWVYFDQLIDHFSYLSFIRLFVLSFLSLNRLYPSE